MSEAFIIAKHLPGAGNPWHLPIDEFNGYIEELAEFFKAQTSQSGPIDHRSLVEEQMRNLGHG